MTIVALSLMHANGTCTCIVDQARFLDTPLKNYIIGAHYFGGIVHVVAMSRKLWRGIGWVCWCRLFSTAASPLR